uniref:Potassium channel domain-containing protein n=1 Tax=Plectus sambesii TaxID=2011161 RepID=A0A914V7R4_9BILA
MQRKNVRAVLLIVCTFTYLMLGAAVFDALESYTDMRKRSDIARIKDRMFQKYNFTQRDYRVLETVVIKSIPHKAGYQWKFAGAFYFATVVITTVGYGHSTPATTMGKGFCMFFALAGIPLGLVMFQSIGERVNTLIAYVLHKLRDSLHAHGLNWLPEISPTHLLVVSLSIGSSVIGLGTYVFHKYEDWDLFEAYYYCVMTLSTIGFGDYVALQTENKLQKTPGYVVFTLLFILFGLAIFSACVNLLVLRFMATNRDAAGNEKEPPRTVVLETLASEETTPNGSMILRNTRSTDSHTASNSSVHRLDSYVRKRSSLLMFQSENDTVIRQPSKLPPDAVEASLFCSWCKKPRRPLVAGSSKLPTKPKYFTVRRMPTTHISHLLASETPESPETEDFLIHDTQASRPV